MSRTRHKCLARRVITLNHPELCTLERRSLLAGIISHGNALLLRRRLALFSAARLRRQHEFAVGSRRRRGVGWFERDGGGGGGSGGASGGGAGGSAGGSGSGGTGVCTPACGEARNCCGNSCTNLQNDPRNCGQCGRACDQNVLCTGGECISPPCEATCEAGASCCGTECCAPGQLCCDPQGPVEIGPRCTRAGRTRHLPHGLCATLQVRVSGYADRDRGRAKPRSRRSGSATWFTASTGVK